MRLAVEMSSVVSAITLQSILDRNPGRFKRRLIAEARKRLIFGRRTGWNNHQPSPKEKKYAGEDARSLLTPRRVLSDSPTPWKNSKPGGLGRYSLVQDLGLGRIKISE